MGMSEELKAFHLAFNNAKEQLKSIRSPAHFMADDDNALRQRRQTISELLSSFGNDERNANKRDRHDRSEKSDGEHCASNWLGKNTKIKKKATHRKKEVERANDRHDGEEYVQRRGSGGRLQLLDDVVEEGEDSEGDEDSREDESNDNGENANRQVRIYKFPSDTTPLRTNVEPFDAMHSREPGELDMDFGDNRGSEGISDDPLIANWRSNDQMNMNKNDLSHEANYKLSKIEQDAAERKPNSWKWKPRLATVTERKRSYAQQVPLAEKRSYVFNPMNEIKLKTSNRLMRKGYGPSLPSYSLVDVRREQMLDKALKRLEQGYVRGETIYKKNDDIDRLDRIINGMGDSFMFPVRTKRRNDVQDKPSVEPSSQKQDNAETNGAVEANGDNQQSGVNNSKNDAANDDTAADDNKESKGKATESTGDANKAPSSDEVKANSNAAEQTNANQQQTTSNGNEERVKEESKIEEKIKKNKRETLQSQLNLMNMMNNRRARNGINSNGMAAMNENSNLANSNGGDANLRNSFGISSNGQHSNNLNSNYRSSNLMNSNSNFNVENDKSKRTTAPDGMQNNRAKRLGMMNDMSGERFDNMHILDDGSADFGVKSHVRTRRSTVEKKCDKLTKDKNFDFDNVELNEDEREPRALSLMESERNSDESRSRFRRSIEKDAAPQTNSSQDDQSIPRTLKRVKRLTLNSTNMLDESLPEHRMAKRSLHLMDDADDNNSDNRQNRNVLAVNYGNSMPGNGKYRQREMPDRDKRIKAQHFLFGKTGRVFEQEDFDNLKQKNGEMKTFDGMKFDNIWDEGDRNESKTGSINMKKNNLHSDLSDRTMINLKNKLIASSLINNLRSSDDTDGDKLRSDSGTRSAKPDIDSDLITDTDTDTDPSDEAIATQNLQSKLKNLKGADKTMIMALRDEILNCTALSKLEDFLRFIPDNNSVNVASTERNEGIADVTADPVGESKLKSLLHAKEPSTSPSSSSCNPGKDETMKLNITINASVMSNEKAKNFFGNGTINVRNSEDRERRDILSPDFFTGKRKCSSQSSQPPPSSSSTTHACNDLDSMMSGKLSSRVVNTLLESSRQDPKMKPILSSLPNNVHCSSGPRDFNSLKNCENAASLNQAERLMTKAMEVLGDVMEQQMRSHSCVPLRPELAQFYELILRVNADQEKKCPKRSLLKSANNDGNNQIRSLDPEKVEEKSRVVKKLLKQYEELPQEDQVQVATMRDDLLMDLVHLRKVKDGLDMQQERRKREIIESESLELKKDDPTSIKELESQVTPQYLKLLKTSELFREAATELDQS